MPTDLIGTVQAVTILRIDRSTLSRWVKDRRIDPALQLPGRTGAMLFHRADVERLALELETGSDPVVAAS